MCMYNIIRRYLCTHVHIFICTVYTYYQFTYEHNIMSQIYGQPLFLHYCYPAFEILPQNYHLHILGIPGEISSIRALLSETEQLNNFVYACTYVHTHVLRHLHINIHIQVGVAYFIYNVLMYVHEYAHICAYATYV